MLIHMAIINNSKNISINILTLRDLKFDLIIPIDAPKPIKNVINISSNTLIQRQLH